MTNNDKFLDAKFDGRSQLSIFDQSETGTGTRIKT